MGLKTLRLFSLALLYLFISNDLAAQENFTGLNGTVINLPCNQTCLSPLKITHLKTTGDYIVTSIPFNPFPFVTPGGTEDVTLYDDDQYSTLFNLPFAFCFYDSSYKNAVIGSNGLITFEETNASCHNSWRVNSPIPFTGGGPCNEALPYYPRASIMGAYTDLDPRDTESPTDRKIEWRVEGTDPFRRFVVSFYHVGVFGNPTCGIPKPNTFQIVIYESTGLIEVYIDQKLCQPNSPGGTNAILGIQNWNRTKAVWPVGKNNSLWTETHAGYRFTPSGAASRFLKSEIFDMAGTLLGTADTITTTPGMLDLNFASICGVTTTTQYVVKTTFSACDGGNDVVASDTITVNKTNGLNATYTFTQASCGQNDGSITVTVPTGVGTLPISYSVDGGAPQAGNIFNGLAAGPHNVHVQDALNACTSDLPVLITSTGTLNVTVTPTNTTCNGAKDGVITVTPPVATAPVTYSLDGGPPVTTNVFTNVLPGNHTIDVRDAGGCQKLGIPVVIAAGPYLTFTASATPTSCPGANNGTITITNVSSPGPHSYSINGSVYQSSNTFTGLPAAPGGHFVLVKDNVLGCTSVLTAIPVPQGAGGLTGNVIATPTSCAGVNNGSIVVTPTTGSGPYEFSINGGTNWQASGTFNGLAAGTYNNIRIREGGICTSNALSATITSGTGLTAVATPTATSCAGVNNGSISVTSTGTAPFTFVLDGTVVQTSPSATIVFNNLAAGAHNITVTDAAGCTTTTAATAIVTAGTGFTATFTASATSCAGAANGVLIITPQNPGTAPFTFVLSPGNITQSGATTTYTGLATGTYSVLITDANGCQFTLNNMTITAGAGLAASATSTSTTCAGVNNGTITVTTNGTAPFTYVLDGTVTQTSGSNSFTFNNVSAGPHTIDITDAGGCINTSPVNATVTAGTGYSATFTANATSCAGANNGSLVITPELPGTAPFTFVLNPGNITQTGTTTTFNGLAPTTYSVLITDASGCQFTLNNMIVTAGAGLTASATSTSASCAGANNGTITVTTNGTAPFTLVMDGTVTQTSPVTTATFTNVGTGPHSITITDATGCITTTPVNVTVTAGAGFTATFTATATSCNGTSNGSLLITPENPLPGPFSYTFILSPGNITHTGSTATFNNLAAGDYSVLITDPAGCQFTLNNMTVAAGAGLQATLTPASTTCAGVNNGSIEVTPTSGTAPFTIVLDGTTTLTGNPVATFTGLAAGTHSVSITDANGCVTVTPLTTTVATGTGFNSDLIATGTSCAGASNGSIMITPQAPASSPYTFVLNPGGIMQTGALNTTFNALAAATYNVTVTDANGCQSVLNNITVIQGAGLQANVSSLPATCFGANNGSITVTPTNGGGPYTFVLNPGAVTKTGPVNTSFTNLIANSYTITVTDAAGCISSPLSQTVTQPAALNAAAPSIQPVKCNGGNDGVITAKVPTGGVPPYSYSLDNIAYQSGTVFNVPQGIYTVYTRDANGCTLSFNNLNVTQPVVLTATAAPVNSATCSGGPDGTIEVTAVGGTAPYQYSSNSTDFQSSNVLNVKAGTYTVTVKDANGCTFNAPPVTVVQTDNLTLTVTNPSAICEGTGVELQATSNADSYSWTSTSANPNLSSTIVANPVASPTQTTLYTVTATLGSCTRTANVTVNVLPAPVPDAGPGDEICYGQNYQLHASGGVTYNWTPATYLNNTKISNPQVVKPDKTITYSVSVTDANNCTSLITDDVTVTVTPPIKVITSPVDTVVHAGAVFQVQAVSAATIYTWDPAVGLSNPGAPNPIVTAGNVGDVTNYHVIASTPAGCQGEGTITVRVYTGPEIFMSNAFTPNNDGKNDVFTPFPVGIKEISYFRVFNRWGNLVFATSGLHHGWDGKTGGMEQPSGAYVWIIRGVTQDGQVINKQGTVTLIR